MARKPSYKGNALQGQPAIQERIITGADPRKQPPSVGPYDPMTQLSPQMIRAIRQSPKGKLPPSLQKKK